MGNTPKILWKVQLRVSHRHKSAGCVLVRPLAGLRWISPPRSAHSTPTLPLRTSASLCARKYRSIKPALRVPLTRTKHPSHRMRGQNFTAHSSMGSFVFLVFCGGCLSSRKYALSCIVPPLVHANWNVSKIGVKQGLPESFPVVMQYVTGDSSWF